MLGNRYKKQEQKGRCKGHLEYVLNTNAFELFITPITVTTTAMATTVYPLLRSLNQVVIVPHVFKRNFVVRSTHHGGRDASRQEMARKLRGRPGHRTSPNAFISYGPFIN